MAIGRPEKPIDWDLVEKLLLYQNPGTRIAAMFGMHPVTFYNRFQQEYGETFTDYASNKYSEGKTNLLAKQFEKALDDGNIQMLLRLGEIYLDQDKIGQNDTSKSPKQNDLNLEHENMMLKNEIKELKDLINANKSKTE